MSTNDGGAAFPRSCDFGDTTVDVRGMTLRDWFAGQALVNMAFNPPQVMAESAYAIADAMLSKRAKEKT